MTAPQEVRAADGPPERLTDGFRAFAAATQGDRERARAILRGMPLVELRKLAEALDDLAGEVDLAENAETWQITAWLARECQEAGLVVVKLQPRNGRGPLTLDVSLWYPVGDRLQIWAEGRGESGRTVRQYITSYRDARAEAIGRPSSRTITGDQLAPDAGEVLAALAGSVMSEVFSEVAEREGRALTPREVEYTVTARAKVSNV